MNELARFKAVVNFEEHCRCLTRLHELCGSAELGLGEFPRM